MGVTGAIYSYDQQILQWINTDSYVVQAENRDKLTPAELYLHFQQVDPKIQINQARSILSKKGHDAAIT